MKTHSTINTCRHKMLQFFKTNTMNIGIIILIDNKQYSFVFLPSDLSDFSNQEYFIKEGNLYYFKDERSGKEYEIIQRIEIDRVNKSISIKHYGFLDKLYQ